MTIDELTPGRIVTLRFGGDPELGNKPYSQPALFIGLTGEGDARRATFSSQSDNSNDTYEWEAYIYEGNWAYGSSAEPLSIAYLQDVSN